MKAGRGKPKHQVNPLRQYEPSFKKAVILYAEQKGTSAARKKYGISETNIRRWRKLKKDIFEKAAQPSRRSKRRVSNGQRCQREGSAENANSLDSMPLQQRIEAQAEQQEPVLQSQPLSPTKLKVTRQAAKPQAPSTPPPPEPPNYEVCLKWNSHYQNLKAAFPALLTSETYADATLVSEGKTIKCHRVILSSCSRYFEEVLKGIGPFQHPVLFMKDTPFWILKALCDFMYAGEVHTYQNKLEDLLKVAEALQIKGLATKPEDTAKVPKEPVEPQIKEEKQKVKEEEKEPPKDEKKREERPKRHPPKEEPLKFAPKPSKSSNPPPKPHPAPQKVPAVPKNPPNFKSAPANVRRLERNRDKKTNDDVTDPLDLLEPVYEEEIKKGPVPAPNKLKEARGIPVPKQAVKKGVPRRIRKRKYMDEREESPPPVFTSRKGTRSRPNVKVPKYFHSSFDNSEIKSKGGDEAAQIVWEPHASGALNPPIQFEEIKAEPIDIEDVPIEVEENLMNFCEEEIIGNYDSPIVNLKSKAMDNKSIDFKKINLVQQPVIMDVCTVGEESREENTLKIVDIKQIGARKEGNELFEDGIVSQTSDGGKEQDPLNFSEKTTESVDKESEKENTVLESEKGMEIVISNVESITENQIAEKMMEGSKEIVESAVLESGNLLGFHIESIVGKFGEDSEKTEETLLESSDIQKGRKNEDENKEKSKESDKTEKIVVAAQCTKEKSEKIQKIVDNCLTEDIQEQTIEATEIDLKPHTEDLQNVEERHEESHNIEKNTEQTKATKQLEKTERSELAEVKLTGLQEATKQQEAIEQLDTTEQLNTIEQQEATKPPKAAEQEAMEQPEATEQFEETDHLDKTERSEATERSEETERPEATERLEEKGRQVTEATDRREATERPESTDDQLLLDDDLSFENNLLTTTTSNVDDGDQQEKTLEMIVNDLNESLERDLRADDKPL